MPNFEKGNTTLIILLVVFVIVLVAAVLMFQKKASIVPQTYLPKTTSNSANPIQQSPSPYQNPFEASSGSSNPFDSQSQNPFDNLK